MIDAEWPTLRHDRFCSPFLKTGLTATGQKTQAN